MGISEHLSFDELGHNQAHLLEGSGQDLHDIAVDELGCGPLTIISPPDHPDDDVRDQHALYLRAKTLSGDEVELMFNIAQVALLHEQTAETQDGYMRAMFNILEAPPHIRDDYEKSHIERQSLIGTINRVVELSEMVLRVRDMEGKEQSESKSDALLRLIKEVVDITDEDDES